MVVEGGSLSRSSVITWHSLLYHKSFVATQLWEREDSLHLIFVFRSPARTNAVECRVLLRDLPPLPDTSRDELFTTLEDRLRRVTLATRGTGTSYRGSLPSQPLERTDRPPSEFTSSVASTTSGRTLISSLCTRLKEAVFPVLLPCRADALRNARPLTRPLESKACFFTQVYCSPVRVSFTLWETDTRRRTAGESEPPRHNRGTPHPTVRPRRTILSPQVIITTSQTSQLQISLGDTSTVSHTE